MAEPCVWRSLCQNPPPVGKDELAGAVSGAFTNDSGTPSLTPAVSRVPTPTSAPLFAPAKLVAKYTNADLEQTTNLALESFV